MEYKSEKIGDQNPKTKFQARLNTILKEAVSKLESFAKDVLPKEELDKINKNKGSGKNRIKIM